MQQEPNIAHSYTVSNPCSSIQKNTGVRNDAKPLSPIFTRCTFRSASTSNDGSVACVDVCKGF